MVNEKPYKPTSGWLGLLGVLTLFGGAVFAIYSLASGPESEGRLIALVFIFVAMLLLMLLTLFGFLAIPPRRHRRPGRRTPRDHGLEPSGGSVQRSPHAAHSQRGLAAQLR